MTGGTLGPHRLDREPGFGGMGEACAAVVEGRARGVDTDGARLRLRLRRATRDRTHRVTTERPVDSMVDHAPQDSPASTSTNVRVSREILAACEEEGIA